MTPHAPTAMRTPPWRGKVGMAALLGAEAVSTIGSRMSFLAIPWLVLVTTGDPVKVGLVAGAETLPYVLTGVFAAPLQDRLGYRRTSIIADFGSMVAMAAIAIGHRSHFGLLMVLVAFAGALRGMGDRSKNNLLKPLIDAAGTNYARVTSAYEGIMRTSGLIGAGLCGVAIAWLGAQGALWLDAATFGVCVLIVITLVPDPGKAAKGDTAATEGLTQTQAAKEPYLVALRSGYLHFKSDRLIRGVTSMLFLTNLFNQASAVVFVPLWVLTVLHSPVALGYVGGAFAIGAILGNIVFTALAPYLRRYPTLVLGYMIGGAPRFLILALTDDLRVVIAVSFVSGLAMCSVNPTIGAMVYQRVPSAMLARVGGIMAAVAFAGMPIGGVLGGLAAERLGLTNGILLVSVLYFVVSLSSVIRHQLWRELDDVPMAKRPIDYGAPVHWTYGRLRSAIGPRVSVHYVRGDWTASARHGLRPLARRQPIRPKVALNALTQLDVPAVHDAVGAGLRNDQARAELQTKQMRAQVAEIESMLSEIGFGLDRRLLPRDIAS